MSAHTISLQLGAAAGGLLDVMLVVLAAAGIVATIASRLKLDAVAAYLITGMIIGPHAIGLIPEGSEIDSVAHLAIILLLFGIGLEFDLGSIRMGVKRVLIAAGLSIVLSLIVLGPIGLFVAGNFRGSVIVAMALCLSSTAVVLQLYQRHRRLTRTDGQLGMSILIVQDLAVVVMLASLPLLGAIAGSPDAGASAQAVDLSLLGILRQIGMTLGFVGLLVLAGKYVLPLMLQEAARAKALEGLIVLSVAFAIGAAALTEWLGLSPELGAFIAGLMLGPTPFRHQLLGQIGTLRGLFMAIFFTTLGASLGAQAIIDGWWVILLGGGLMILIKSVLIAFACWSVGAPPKIALKVGLTLSQAGEFGLILAGRAASDDLGLITQQTADRITAITILSLILTPVLFTLADALAHRVSTRATPPWLRTPTLIDADERPDAPGRDLVIVAGYGIVGRAVTDHIATRPNTCVTIIELNMKTIGKQTSLGRSVVYGDASDPGVLESAGINHARILVLTIPDPLAVLGACKIARQMNPGVFIVARTSYVSQATIASGLGANAVIAEELVTAQEVERVLQNALDQRPKPDDDDRGDEAGSDGQES
ncbi:MAG: cation:proton antiporter [Planctomycetota bacterium]